VASAALSPSRPCHRRARIVARRGGPFPHAVYANLAPGGRIAGGFLSEKQSAQLSKVREFSKEYLADKHDTMFYMFSGPDFLYATLFFPNAGTHVLAGLEIHEVNLVAWTSRETFKPLMSWLPKKLLAALLRV
jgi:hypothetical protein